MWATWAGRAFAVPSSMPTLLVSLLATALATAPNSVQTPLQAPPPDKLGYSLQVMASEALSLALILGAAHASESCPRGDCVFNARNLATAGVGTWVLGPALVHSAHAQYLRATMSLALRGTVFGMAKWFDWTSLCERPAGEECAFGAGFAFMGFMAGGLLLSGALDIGLAARPIEPPRRRISLLGTGPLVAGKDGGLGWGVSGAF